VIRPARALLVGGLTAAGGVVLLLRPGEVASLLGDRADRPIDDVIRLLGARYLGQGTVVLAHPSRTVLRGAALVDALHAASMIALAASPFGHRRAALVSAAAGLAAAASEHAASRKAPA
jgi:hypothetical protein